MSRPWHRSPVLWFALPGLLFFIVAWIDSMSHITGLGVTAFGRSVHFRNSDSIISASWYSGRHPGGSHTNWNIRLDPRTSDPGESWFPLPSYVATNYVGGGPTWHHVKLSYWFLILVYLGLWQLPWLLRYHRRQRIRRSLTAPPPPAQPHSDL